VRAVVLALVLPIVLGAACNYSGNTTRRGIVRAPQEHGYPMDGVLRVNHVQTKGTHNSYHVETPGNTYPEWHYSLAPLDVQLESQGVRGLELDTRYVAATDRFEVFHVPLFDEQTNCRVFVDCLKLIKTWSDAHAAHPPLLVQLEPKDDPTEEDAEPYFTKMEGEILSVWPRERILTPDDVQQEAPTLRAAVTTKGWPTLGETRGTVLFYIDNRQDFRRFYTRGGKSLERRLMFVDSLDDDPLAAVIIVNDPTEQARIDSLTRAGFLVRTVADASGSPVQRQEALATGAQILSSDFPLEFTIPGGTPARCNPLTAPPGCTPSAIEDPSRLR
jgi:hypothetical protein